MFAKTNILVVLVIWCSRVGSVHACVCSSLKKKQVKYKTNTREDSNAIH
jgi:hypothetical protein